MKCLDFYPNWGWGARDTARITDRKGSSAQNRCLKMVLVFSKHCKCYGKCSWCCVEGPRKTTKLAAQRPQAPVPEHPSDSPGGQATTGSLGVNLDRDLMFPSLIFLWLSSPPTLLEGNPHHHLKVCCCPSGCPTI